MDPGDKEDVRRSHQRTVSALERMRAGNYRAAVGNKETLAAIAAHYEINRSNIHNKIKLLEEDYASFRRIRQDGNNFYRSFMFSYLVIVMLNTITERVMETQDLYEFDRVLSRILWCRRMNAILGAHEYTFDELSQELQHVLERIIHAAPNSTSADEFLLNCLDEHASLNVMIFFRLVTSIEIHMNSNYYRPKMHAKYRSMEEFVLEQDMIVDFETDQLRVKALSEALGIPTKVVQFDVLAPVPENPKLPYCFFDGSSRRNFNLGLLSDDFLLISGSSDEHAVPATGPPYPGSSVSDAADVGGTSDYDSVIILDPRAPSYVTLVFWRGHYGVLYRNSVLSGLKNDFFSESRTHIRGERYHMTTN